MLLYENDELNHSVEYILWDTSHNFSMQVNSFLELKQYLFHSTYSHHIAIPLSFNSEFLEFPNKHVSCFNIKISICSFSCFGLNKPLCAVAPSPLACGRILLKTNSNVLCAKLTKQANVNVTSAVLVRDLRGISYVMVCV